MTPYVKSVPLIVNVRPQNTSSLGNPVNVRSFERMCVRAKAMFSVPSVTMNGGSRTPVTSPPVKTPKPTQVRMPSRSAGSAGTPLSTASFVMITCPSAMTVPTERSMPAVRITSVCPIARTPTIITCCNTSEKFCAWKNRSVFSEKNAIVRTSAMSGPTVGAVITRRTSWSVPVGLKARS